MTFPLAAGDKPTATALNVPYNAWSTWTPTLTNLTLGNGVVVARYLLVGKTLHYHFKFTLGSTSAVGTDPKFTLPATPHSSYLVSADTLGRGTLLDSGTVNRDSVARVDSGATVLLLAYGTTGSHATITATSPWTWTTNDVIMVAGTIETA